MSQNLSPFHFELIDFIKRDVASKIASDGFDESVDPALKTFRESIEKAQEGTDPLLLSEIIDHYQYIFTARGPLYLEKKLLESLDRIRIHRGVPRLYRREKPADSRIKKQFAHLPTLKKLAAEKWVFQAYGEKEFARTARVTFFTWVIRDGWGDYIAALESIEILRRRFVDLQIGWVVLFPKRLGSPRVPTGVKTHLIYYEKQSPLSLINSEAKEILRTSDLVMQISSFYPESEALESAVQEIPFFTPPPSWLSIGEYGFLESDWHHPCSGNRSMGLHFLDKGVLVKEEHRSTEPSFRELENQDLLEWLFGTSVPEPAEIEQYKRDHHFYLAYLATPTGGAVYLHALIKAHEGDKKGIDLCCPNIDWLIHHIQIQTSLGRPVLEAEGILELHYEGKIVTFTDRKEGKRIRIFSPTSLNPADFHLLVHLSGEWIGIRGDQSFTESISAGKGFFYDGRVMKRHFLKDLLALAESRIKAHRSTLAVLRGCMKASLHNVPMGNGEWVEETDFQEREPWKEIAWKIGAALQDPDCVVGFKKLNWIISQEHSFNDFLCQLVRRELCLREHPGLAREEEEAIRPFVEGRVPLSQALQDLKNRLYRERLKNRELSKEAPQILRPERAAFVPDKGPSEDAQSGVKPTPDKTDFSITSGITHGR